MITIYIVADSYKIYETAIQEYQKRLGRSLVIEKIKPFKNKNTNLVVEKETLQLLKILEKDKAYRVVLSPQGKRFSTQKLYDHFEVVKQNFGNVSFYIGGANGLDYKKVRPVVNLELSLSDFTLPHSLALLVLTEQMYRLSMINKGTNYNK